MQSRKSRRCSRHCQDWKYGGVIFPIMSWFVVLSLFAAPYVACISHAGFRLPSCSGLINFVVVSFSPTVLKLSNFERFEPFYGVRHQFAWAPITFIISNAVLSAFGAHRRDWDEAMQTSRSAGHRSVRRLVHCSLGQCCWIRMVLLQRIVEALLATFTSVLSLIA